jgi:hypothetical protein
LISEDKIATIGLEITKTQQEMEELQRQWDGTSDITSLEE